MPLAQTGTERGAHDRVAQLLDKTHQRIVDYLDAHRIEGRAQRIGFCMLIHCRSHSGVIPDDWAIAIVELAARSSVRDTLHALLSFQKKMPSRMDRNVPFGWNDRRRSVLVDDCGTLEIRGSR